MLIRHLVLKNVPVPRQALLEINNHLVGLAHRPDLNPRLKVGLLGQLQHITDVLPGPDQGTCDLEVLEDQTHRAEAGERIIGSTELDECAVDVKQLEVLVEREAAGDSRDDQVKTVGVLGSPLRVLTCRNEAVSAQLDGILLLGRGARDGNDLISSHGLGKEKCEVAETANTDNTNALAGTGTVCYKRVVDCDTTAHQGSGEFGRKTLRDRNGE